MSLIEALISPTFVLFLTALIAVAALQGRLRGRLAAALWLCLGWGYVTSAPLTVNAAVQALERRAGAPCKSLDDGATLLVLMGGVQLGASSSRDYARLHEASIRRLLEAKRLTSSAADVTVFVSGGLRTGETTEGQIGAELLADLGVPRAHIHVEAEGQTTTESAAALSRMLDSAQAPRGVALVTSAMHMPRARLIFERQGMSVQACPADFRHIPSRSLRALLPQTGAVERARNLIHEAAGLAWAAVTS